MPFALESRRSRTRGGASPWWMPFPTRISFAWVRRWRTCAWSPLDQAWQSAFHPTHAFPQPPPPPQATPQEGANFIATGKPAFALDPRRIAAGEDVEGDAIAWATPLLAEGAGPVLIYSTATPESVAATQSRLGGMEAGAMVERCIAAISQRLVSLGVRQLVVAGGETSGACVQALGIAQLQIGPQIDPGVPWCYARVGTAEGAGLHLTLKSGNFGGEDFFTKAFKVLP